MTVPRKLTPAEARAVAALRKIMLRWPTTLHLLTSGNRDLSVIDAALADGDLHDGHARRRGAVLADLSLPVPVHGVSA